MGPMKVYPSFDAYLKNRPAAHPAVIRALRMLARRAAPSLVVMAIALVCLSSCAGRLPTDGELRAHFMGHQGELDSLAALASVDTQLVQVLNYGGSVDAYVHEGGSYDRRVREETPGDAWRSPYRRLVASAGIRRMWRDKDGRVWFRSSENSKGNSGFVYCPEPPPEVRHTLEGIERTEPDPIGYVQISGKWYMWRRLPRG